MKTIHLFLAIVGMLAMLASCATRVKYINASSKVHSMDARCGLCGEKYKDHAVIEWPEDRPVPKAGLIAVYHP